MLANPDSLRSWRRRAWTCCAMAALVVLLVFSIGIDALDDARPHALLLLLYPATVSSALLLFILTLQIWDMASDPARNRFVLSRKERYGAVTVTLNDCSDEWAQECESRCLLSPMIAAEVSAITAFIHVSVALASWSGERWPAYSEWGVPLGALGLLYAYLLVGLAGRDLRAKTSRRITVALAALLALFLPPVFGSEILHVWMLNTHWAVGLLALSMAGVWVTSLILQYKRTDSKSYARWVKSAEQHKMRKVAALALGEIGDGSAVEPLIGALKDEAMTVRQAAATSLGTVGNPSAVGPLIGALCDKEMPVRYRAAGALGKIGDGHGVNALIGALKDEHSDVRKAVATALGEIGGPGVVEALIPILKDESGDVRESAATALGTDGDPGAVDPLIEALIDEDSKVRSAAADSLQSIGEPQWTDCISGRGEIADDFDRIAATGNHRILKPLAKALEHSNKDVRQAAVAGLGRLGTTGDNRSVDPLIGALADEDGTVREAAATALGDIGDIRAAEPLLDTLTDEDGSVRVAVATSLQRMGEAQWNACISGQNRIEDDFKRIAAIDDPRVFRLLSQALQHSSRRVRQATIAGLGELGAKGDHRAMDFLIAGLADEDSDVRKAAARTLGEIGNSRAVDPLLGTLTDKNGTVRFVAAEALGKIADDRAVNALVDALKDESGGVHGAAAMALGQIGNPSAVGPLIGALKGGDSSLHRAAATALREIGDPGAVDAFVTALTYENSDVRQIAATALGQIGDRRIAESLIGALADETKNVRIAAAAALDQLGDPQWKACIQGNADDLERLLAVGDPRSELVLRRIIDKAFSFWGKAKQMPFPVLAEIGLPVAENIVERLVDPKEEACKLAVKTLVCMCRNATGADAVRVKRALDAAEARGGPLADKVRHVRDNIGNRTIPTTMADRPSRKWTGLWWRP